MSRACALEVKRVLRLRAVSVDLNPEVQENCIADITYICADKDHRGGDLACLKAKYDQIEDDSCREVVGDLIEESDKNTETDRALMKSCSNMIKKFCGVCTYKSTLSLLPYDVTQVVHISGYAEEPKHSSR